MRHILAAVISLPLIVAMSSCVTVDIPVQEYTLARAARDAAISAEAAKYAPQLFYRADKIYKRAETLFRDRYYSDAQDEFLEAQRLCEKAETAARLKQFQAGDASGG
jgi:hypothetical protein